MRPRVKICCIASFEEAQTAIECGASAVGLVSEMPSGPGVISEELIAEIAARVPPPVATFLLTCRQDAEAIVEQQRKCRVNTIQLCDRVASDVYTELRARLPGVSLVQVIHVAGEESFDEALTAARRGQGTRRHGSHARLAREPERRRSVARPGLSRRGLAARERRRSGRPSPSLWPRCVQRRQD
jgi:phosphoribosylanthranilate isomerase